MLLVMIAVAIAAIVALSFVSRQATTIGIRENVDAHARARAVAESGMRLALRHLSENDTWFTDGTAAAWASAQGSPPQTFELGSGAADGEYRVRIESLPGDHKSPFPMMAEGRWGGAVARVRATVTPIPRAGTMLMIVGTLPLTDPGDIRMKEMFESWGYLVKLIDDDEVRSSTPAAINAHAAAVGVIYVSTTVNSGDIGTRLNAVQRGAVTTETQLNDEWGFSTGYVDSLPNSDRIHVLDASHDITGAFGLGTEIITEQPAKLRYLSGTFAPNAKWLARHPTNTSYRAVAALEKDATGINSITAPARRVILPWSVNADPSWLTASGQALVQNALEWASITPETRPFGVATRQFFRLNGASRIDAATPAAYNPASNSTGLALVATNGTAADSIGVYSSSALFADAYAGMGADPATAIKVAATAQFGGSKNSLRLPLSFDSIVRPTHPGQPIAGTFPVNGTTPFVVPPTTYDMVNFIVTGNGTLQMGGHVIARCSGELILDQSVKVDVPAGTSLTIYAKKLTIRGTSNMNMLTPGSISSGRVNLYMDGTNPLRIEGGAEVAASVHGPNSPMQVAGSSRFFGRFVGQQLEMYDTARYTQDLSLGQPSAGTGGATLATTYRYVARWSDQR